MFPVAADRLSMSQIADFWASEIATGDVKLRERREVNIRDLLVSAWWRGELVGATRRTRLDFLKSLYVTFDDEITFVLPGKGHRAIKKQEGSTRIWVTVPSVDLDAWTVETCEVAFGTLATKWKRLRGNPDADPVIEATEPTTGYRALAWEIESFELLREEFLDWAASKRFELPKFWGPYGAQRKQNDQAAFRNVGDTEAPGRSIEATMSLSGGALSANRRGRKPRLQEKTRSAMISDIQCGRLSAVDLQNLKEEALASRYGVSRETARVARTWVLTKQTIVGKSISDK